MIDLTWEECVEDFEAAVMAKWAEIAPHIDGMVGRIGSPHGFPVASGSLLAQDDLVSHPYEVSNYSRICLTIGVDHLHAVKALVMDAGFLHTSAPYSLARGALENLAIAFWILHPPEQNLRVERTLRWWAQNFRDEERALSHARLPDMLPLETNLAKLDAVADPLGISSDFRAGYSSTSVLKYAAQQLGEDEPLMPWRICSGFAHGRPWAYLGMSAIEQRDTSEAGLIDIHLTSDHGRILFPTLMAFRLMLQVIGRWHDLSQQPDDERE